MLDKNMGVGTKFELRLRVKVGAVSRRETV